ncbi:MAG: ferrochelatase [Calditrichaeota bacterium]|nr:MAG: ferrochelatase [Calditrichota bacterium]
MKISPNDKVCVVLLGMGGPNNLSDIKSFLYNIFSDREIIQLPGGAIFQKPFAKMISSLRYKSVQDNYRKIGGSSPLFKWTTAQKDNIEFSLAPVYAGFEVFIAMRYFHPLTADTIKTINSRGFNKVIVLPMYPQYCKATTGSSFNVFQTELKKYPDIKAEYINDFHDNQKYIELMREYIDNNIQDDEILMFSAHSIPQKFVDEGDPYVDQVRKTANLAADKRDFILSFQSRTGPVKWVGPDTVDETKRLISEGKKLFIVPISFVCDHIETLFELDIELKEFVDEKYQKNIRRMPMFNDDKNFGAMLTELILEKLND